MTALRAYDAANPGISIAAMVSHGAIAAPVYIRGTPGGFQPSDTKRVAALRKAGLAPWPNWEQQADFFAHCSLDEARRAGVEARECAQRLGFPDDGTVSVPFSFDYQVPASQFKAALGKLRSCQDGLGDAFIATSYGQSSLIRYFGHNGFGHTGHWLMASTWGLPDYDIGSPFVAMVQSHNADGSWLPSPIPGTDANTVTRPHNLAAWWPDDSPYKTGEFTMDAQSKTEITQLLSAQEKRIETVIDRKIDAAVRELTGRIGHVIHPDAAHPHAQDATGPLIAEIHAKVTGKADA